MKEAHSALISVVTATYNAASHLPGLIESLRAQTDRNFEWVVADGGSLDGTLGLLETAADLVPRVLSEPDFGIYDALNRAVRAVSGEYYIVIGADDRFYPDAIAEFRKVAASTRADIIAAQVDSDAGRLTIHEGKGWLYGGQAFVASHSVGTLLRRSLHERFGYYSKHLPITADTFFIKKACQQGATRHQASFVAGFFSAEGISNTAVVDGLIEGLKIQMATERWKFFQLLLFFARMVKNYNRW